MSSSASAMPPSTSPRLKIGQATDAENIDIWTLKWHPPLNQSAYVAKEEHCASQLITANRGITHWILYEDEGSPSSSTENQTKAMKKVLASTDTIRRRALVTTFAHDGQAVLQEVPCHQICRMFCRKEHRGKRYPARMLQELKPVLETWQQEDGGAKVKFTVLYSDVGKTYYGKLGWKPYTADNIVLPPTLPSTTQKNNGKAAIIPTPIATPLYASDLPTLCLRDEELIKHRMKNFTCPDPSAIKLALVPDYPSIQWHHAAEEHEAHHLLQWAADIKGAIVSVQQGKVWCVWRHEFHETNNDQETDYKIELHMLRLVIDTGFGFEDEMAEGVEGEKQEVLLAVEALLRAAQAEAADWGMQEVIIKNPTLPVTLAAEKIDPGVRMVHRESTGIPSLMWYGSLEEAEKVEWLYNEEYGDF